MLLKDKIIKRITLLILTFIALNIPKISIDYLNLSIPRYIINDANISILEIKYLLLFPLLLFYIINYKIIKEIKNKNIFFTLLLICYLTIIELLHGSFLYIKDFSLIIEILLLFLFFYTIYLYEEEKIITRNELISFISNFLILICLLQIFIEFTYFITNKLFLTNEYGNLNSIAIASVIFPFLNYQNNKNNKNFIIFFSIAVCSFLINSSFSAFIIFLICLIHQLIKNNYIKEFIYIKIKNNFLLFILFSSLLFIFLILFYYKLQDLSSFSRINSIIYGLKVFLDNPLLGNGYGYERLIKYYDYKSHNLWIIFISSYGLFGSILLIYFLNIKKTFGNLLILLSGIFFNDVLLIYAIIFNK